MTWRRVWQVFRPEFTASALVLLTFFPQRIFATFWPWYSQLLGDSVYRVAGLFCSRTQVRDGSCAYSNRSQAGRIDCVCLFRYRRRTSFSTLLFGIVVAVDWNRLNKAHAVVGYGLVF
jgi:hypothetical protein